MAIIFFTRFIKNMNGLCANKISYYLRPFKPHKMPKHLIYSVKNVKMFDMTSRKIVTVNLHRMADTENGTYAGEMITRPVRNLKWAEVYPDEKICDALKIEFLKTEERGNGYGSDFLKFAENESKAQGCDGRVFLVASRIYDPRHPCHIFYRKQGYTSTDNYINYILDKCIKNGSKLEPEYADNLIMYKPLKIKQPRQEKPGLFAKLKDLLKRFI